MEMEIVKHPTRSDRSIAANRQNAKESTGPGTLAVAPVGVHPGRDRRAFGFSNDFSAPFQGRLRPPLQHGWYSVARPWTPSVHVLTPADSEPAGGLERGARSRPECGGCVDKTGPREEGRIFLGTKPRDPFRINMTFRKSLESKAAAVLEAIADSPASWPQLAPAAAASAC